MVPVTILCLILALYGHCQPYKSVAANILEAAVLSNFLILVLLRYTPHVIDTYFTFSSSHYELPEQCTDIPSGIATVTWILMPLYYLPVVLFLLTAGVYITISVR